MRQRKAFVLYVDNSPIHKSKPFMETMASIPVQLAPYPPYSSDLARSNFFSFGYIKWKSIDREFDSSDTLIAWINISVETIPKPVLEQVIEVWIRQVEQCIDNEGSDGFLGAQENEISC
jgi:hypothetical protein